MRITRREAIQLFIIGLYQLDMTGTPILVNGGKVPGYDQSTVTEMAKVMTGWTYPPIPGFASHWKNPPYYFDPMVAFEAHHDKMQKSIKLPIARTILAGGTALDDRNQALDCLYKQAHVQPFIAYQLIQRFVMSNLSPGYVSRVANAFKSSGGNLQATLTQVLTDCETTAGMQSIIGVRGRIVDSHQRIRRDRQVLTMW
jgi:uncharacterized protein (DUF1800 family)